MSVTSNSQNNISYEEKYESGFGLHYPDSHVMRLFEKFLKYEYGKTSGRMIDICCSI